MWLVRVTNLDSSFQKPRHFHLYPTFWTWNISTFVNLFPSIKETSMFCMTVFAMLSAPCALVNLGVSKQNFHSKGVGGPTRDSGSRVTARHVELGLLAIAGVGELGMDNTNQTDGDTNWTQEKGASLFLIGFVDRECCWCCFCLVFFSGAGTATWFVETFGLVPYCQHLPASAPQKTSIKD